MPVAIKNPWKPEVYHGKRAVGTFFEGWYFKMVDESLENILIIIPGAFKDKEEQHSHAFVQIMDGTNNRSGYVEYALEDFDYSDSTFDISVGSNHFSRHRMRLDIESPDYNLCGELSFHNTMPWPSNIFSPGAMGWYAFLPFMQCYHEVLSMDHRISGQLQINGNTVDFDRGRGYMEKNWGSAFPSDWVWMQSNHFMDLPGTSLTLSIARVPILGRSIVGCLCGFFFQDKLLRFTTYNGAQVRHLVIDPQHVEVALACNGYTLEVNSPRTSGALLRASNGKEMVSNVVESITPGLEVRLHKNNQLLYSGLGRCAGLEVHGSLEKNRDPG